MALSYTHIMTTNLVSQTNLVSLTSIPQTYTDLLLKLSVRTNRDLDGFGDMLIRFNSSSTSDYRNVMIQGNGSTSGGSTSTTDNCIYYVLASSVPSNSYFFNNGELLVPNYAGNKYKSIQATNVAERNTSTGIVRIHAGVYPYTTAVSSIDISDGNGAYMQPYSKFSLYGVH